MAAFVQTADLLPDGVHIGLTDAEYFGQDALGSTDLIRLHKRRHGWWWGSRHNPDYRAAPNKALAFGHALHAIMLEGLPAYESRFLALPEKPEGSADTIEAMQDALRGAGLNVDAPETKKWKRADWLSAMRDNIPAHPCWANIEADFQQALAEMPERSETISALDDRMVRVMLDAALSDEEIAALIQERNNPPLAEIAIFATLRDGTRRRWKLDRLYPGFTMDLKSLSGWTGRPLPWATGDQIAKLGMDIQRADYDRARLVLNAYVRDGFQVYGGTVEQRDWLRRLVEATADEGGWDWLWLFYQKPDPKGHAPVIFPVLDERWVLGVDGEKTDADLFRYGAAKADDAMAFYRAMRDRFGLDRPWTYVEKLHYTDENAARRIFLPHWISETAPTEDAAAYVGAEEPADA